MSKEARPTGSTILKHGGSWYRGMSSLTRRPAGTGSPAEEKWWAVEAPTSPLSMKNTPAVKEGRRKIEEFPLFQE